MLLYLLAILVLYMSATAKKETLPHTPSHIVYERMVDNGDDAQLFLEMETALIEADSVGQAQCHLRSLCPAAPTASALSPRSLCTRRILPTLCRLASRTGSRACLTRGGSHR